MSIGCGVGRSALRACWAVGALLAGAGEASALSYGESWRAIGVPPAMGSSFSTVGDVLPDGRIITTTGDGVFMESAVGSGVFARVATLDVGLFGGDPDPAFLRVSPDGARIALGGGFGKPLAVFGVGALGDAMSPSFIGAGSADVYAVGHYDAAWADATSLALSAGDFGSPGVVTLLDVTSSTAAPVNPVIVSNIGGASSGIAFDSAGRLYTGNGFDAFAGGSETGWIKAFSIGEWSAGVDFEAGGVLIADALSAGALTFDALGNLAVGGGDFGVGDTGAVAVLRAAAIAGALAGMGAIDSFDSSAALRLDPRGDGLGFFGAEFNPVTGELYVTGGSTWWATVPSPGGGWLLVGAGGLGVRRRRERRGE